MFINGPELNEQSLQMTFKGCFLKLLSQMTKTWWEAPMGGSVLSFLKAE
jgi:hypothetical protein